MVKNMRHITKAIRLALLCSLFVAGTGHVIAGDEAPDWLKQLTSVNLPQYDKKVPAVVLLDQQSVTVYDDGRIETTNFYAVKMLRREGRDYATARALYLTNSAKVKEIKAWLIRSNGLTKKYGKDETADLISDPDDIYNEYRFKQISARDDADGGDIFAYQTVTEERSIFGEDRWYFQSDLPTLTSRFSATLPAGWTAEGMTFNHAPVEPVITGTNYTWELRNLPFIRDEEQGPTIPNLVPRLAVYYIAPSASGPLRSYKKWSEVSRWLTDLHEPQVIVDDAVAAKARELTADAKTELEKIQAIGRFVQNIQYISIDIGIGRGNGMKPHASNQVLSKAYGDCKDKANLMRAMLRALRITAYPVGIYSGDRNYVREQWASPSQFNHCIIAITVSDETTAPTVIEHADLGRLLIFDPTDDNTPVGDLPDHEQGSWALVIAGEKGSLTRMPVTPPESNQLLRTAQIELLPDGSVKALLKESSMGQAAAWERGLFRRIARPQYNQMIEEWITQGATGAKVAKVEPADGMKAGTFDLNVEFTALGYGQVMQDRLLVFKPAVVSRSEGIPASDEKRTQPVVLKSRSYQETVRVKLPTDFEVDEIPDPLKLDTPFGSYNASFEVVDGQLVFKRSLVQKAATIPVEQYGAVRNFFGRILALEQSPVVLARK